MRTQAISFGKSAVMTCTVKSADKKTKVDATLYQMNPLEREDYKDVMYSKHTLCIKPDFQRDTGHRQGMYDYYLLQNNKTKEVIACAQTSRHYRTGKSSLSARYKQQVFRAIAIQ